MLENLDVLQIKLFTDDSWTECNPSANFDECFCFMLYVFIKCLYLSNRILNQILKEQRAGGRMR